MGATTGITWTDRTFNIVWGCHKVSDECKHCYAETWSKRVGLKVWGQNAPRRTFGEKHWREPLKWNRDAERAGRRSRVFCSSMADVFEDHPTVAEERLKLWPLIADTPWLDWQLLTKRPENMRKFAPSDWLKAWPSNVWAGTTVGVHSSAHRLDDLRKVPATIRFVSCEPLLEDLGDIDLSGIQWVIIGGESGPRARPFAIEWGERLASLATSYGASVFWKQLGAHVVSEDRVDLDGNWAWRAGLKDRHGGDMSEWPEALRVREFPRTAQERQK